jgi:HD-like signal output (HDOD) protein
MELGAWLMEAWNMPTEIIAVQKEHHNTDYDGVHASYVRLVMLADHLLKGLELGDETIDSVPAELLTALGLEQAQVMKVLERTVESRDELDTMARQLVA